ncbi:MAG: ATP-dependent RecD-like DNA helicase [Clostridia bacterium]|nr:ATP-dependent RecD-like DNA helicase [Clostridia bacterium]
MDRNGEETVCEFRGTVEEIIFNNSENGYSVFVLDCGDSGIITAVGKIPFISEGENLAVYGSWTVHPVYGEQLSVTSFERFLPADTDSMLRYLSSGVVKGIGPKIAGKIVEKYGMDSFEILENHPDWLAEIPGISKRKAAEICENFKNQSGMRSVMIFCGEYFGTGTTVKIYRKWGQEAVDIIRSDPYRLCEEIDGIGFEKADAVAESMGFSRDSSSRIRSGIKYVLNRIARNQGHTSVPEEGIVKMASELLEAGTDTVSASVDEMLKSGELYRLRDNDGRELIFLKEYYQAERFISDKLMMLSSAVLKTDPGDAEMMIEKIELREGIRYASEQRRAILCALNESVFILTGGPGTGKTTVVKALIGIFEDMGQRVALAAPTGRAAQRLSEATSSEARTIHRLLEMMRTEDDGENYFARNENNLLEEDVIIVDEASMIDVILMCALLKAVKRGARIILIGDADQLPSVGPGNVLRDLLASGLFKTVHLDEIFRQETSSLIVYNAHEINTGNYPETGRKDADFFFIKRSDDESIAKTIVDLCAVRLPNKLGYDCISDIQVISPSRKGTVGAESLNLMLQDALNPRADQKPEKMLFGTTFRCGDKIMQTKNDYAVHWEKDGVGGEGIFNGDLGAIEDIDLLSGKMELNFDGRRVFFDFVQCDELSHAYAVTVHKSQGSEYPVVIIPAGSFAPQLRTRNLLYTAITRAKKMVIIVGRQEVIREMVDNDRQVKRYTGLLTMLSDR